MKILDLIINRGQHAGHDLSPKIKCADGTELSVQASSFHYCTPRLDCGPYTEVEVGFPTSPPPASWEPYADGPNPDVWGCVPVELVRQFIDNHGGEA